MDEDINKTNDTEVVEGEILPAKAAMTSTKQVNEMLQIEGLIKRYAGSIAQLKNELKVQKEMLGDVFAGDEVYKEQDRQVKEATKVRNDTKKQLSKQAATAQLVEKIGEMKFQLKESEAALSDYLQQYQKLSGATEIEMEDGTMMALVSVVRLVKRTAGAD